MPLPLKVLNRLRLGRPVAARVSPTQTGRCAWVHVAPVAQDKGDLYETRYLNRDYQVVGFLIRRVEAEQADAEAFSSGLLDDPAPAVDDRRLMASSEEELERLLSVWLPDPAELRVPQDVGYWYWDEPDEAYANGTDAEPSAV